MEQLILWSTQTGWSKQIHPHHSVLHKTNTPPVTDKEGPGRPLNQTHPQVIVLSNLNSTPLLLHQAEKQMYPNTSGNQTHPVLIWEARRWNHRLTSDPPPHSNSEWPSERQAQSALLMDKWIADVGGATQLLMSVIRGGWECRGRQEMGGGGLWHGQSSFKLLKPEW